MAPTIALIFDLVIAGLLIATIAYAVVLNRRLVELQDSRGELEGLIRSFSEATSRAEAGIKAMKRTATETGEGLQKNLERGKALRDELQFMIEAADALAQRLAEAPTTMRVSPQSSVARRPVADPPRPEPARVEPARVEPSRIEPRRLPLESSDDADLPRGRGALTRLDSFLSDPARAEPRSLPESSRAEARVPPEPEGDRDLPRGRGALARLDSFLSDPSRTEGRPSDAEAERESARGRGIVPRAEASLPESARRSGGRAEVAERPMLADESRPARREGTEGLSRAERELLEAMESRP